MRILLHYKTYGGSAVPFLEDGTPESSYPFVVVPIGNWSLLSLLLPDFIDTFWFGETSDCVFIGNETTWGYRYEDPNPSIDNVYHIEFSKEDGVMSYYYGEYFRQGAVTNRTLECIRVTPGAITIEDIVLFGGIIGALTVVTVALVIVNKRRGT